MSELKENKRKNGRLSLYPLKFEGVVKDLLRIKPEARAKNVTTKIVMSKEGEK